MDNGKGFTHLHRALGCSLKGLRWALKHEEAFRQEAILLCVLIPLGIWLGKNGVERILLVGTLLVVLVAELLNTALETVVDRIGLGHHPLSARAKDLGSAAVFVALLNALLTWLFLLCP